MRLYSADITGSLVVSGSLIVTGSTAANPTIINPGGNDLEGNVFIVTGSSAITRDLTIGDDLIVKDETDLEKEVRIGYNSSESNFNVAYQLNVTASVNSPYSANFDGDVLITGSLVDKDNATGTAGQVLSSTGTQLQWIANDGAGITGTGTVGTIPKFTASTVLDDSIITEAASAITISGNNSSDLRVNIDNLTDGYASKLSLYGANNAGARFNYLSSGVKGATAMWRIDGGGVDNNLVMYTGGSEAMRISSGGDATFSGNVGIGTGATLSKRLNVYDSSTSKTAQQVISDGGSTSKLYLGTFSNNAYLSQGGTYSSGWASDGANAIANIVMSATDGNSQISFQTSTANNVGPTDRLTISSGGQVIVGGTAWNGVSGVDGGFGIEGNNAQFLLDNPIYNHFTMYSASDSNIYNIFGTSGDYLIGTGNKDTSSFSQKMRISSGGDVAIGSSASKGFLNSNGTAFELDVNRNPNTGAFGDTNKSHARIAMNGASGGSSILFKTASANNTTATTKLTIGSNGVTSVNGSNAGTVFGVTNTSTTTPYGVSINMSSGGNNTSEYFIGCGDSIQGRFYVWSNGNVQNTNNSYGQISDIKLKENIADATPKLDDLLKVKVKNFNFIGDDTKQIGVIAQELEEIFPSMIEESPDREDREVTDEEGNVTNEKVDLGTVTKSVKYSVFTPMLIKAIQEQQTIIEDLKARIETLEG